MTDPTDSDTKHDDETRFAFGKNWASFLKTIDESCIEQAETSLSEMLGVIDLRGKRFLDIGSGSGLFSLAAARMGAAVESFDYDPQSVACTREMQRRFAPENASWNIQQGSVLDRDFIQRLGMFDVVYSWGVLHHTGEMNQAIRIAQSRVADGGRFFIAIYNDQGRASRMWLRIKQTYHRFPVPLRGVWVAIVASWYETKFALARLVRLKNPLPFADWRAKKQDRGMSAWHDWVDWIGGLPFEVARPEEIIVPLADQGFALTNLKTVGNGWGCNEYVFRKT